jgi:hypothetical protein
MRSTIDRQRGATADKQAGSAGLTQIPITNFNAAEHRLRSIIDYDTDLFYEHNLQLIAKQGCFRGGWPDAQSALWIFTY